MPLAFSKPEPRARVKRRRLTAKQAKRRICVEAVWKRDHGRCRVCLAPLRRPSDACSVFAVGHVHEVTPRSLGGDPGDPENCQLLCNRCHSEAHRLRVAGASFLLK